MWNYSNTQILFNHLRSKREEALKKGKKDSALGYEIIHFIAQNAGTVYTGQELVEEFGLKSTTSLGAHLKAQTVVMKQLGMDYRSGHTWFVDWKESVPTWSYWLSSPKAEHWLKCMKEIDNLDN